MNDNIIAQPDIHSARDILRLGDNVGVGEREQAALILEEEAGADAIRWYFCVSNPVLTSRFSARLVREAAQSFLLPLWNALSFFTIYANLDGWSPGARTPEHASRPALDRWILARLDRLTEETGRFLADYSVTDAARGIEAFIDDVTNWYIRRSRDRFWAPEGVAEAAKDDYRFSAIVTGIVQSVPFTMRKTP